MMHRQLGKTKLLVSEMGLGTAQLGGVSLIGGKRIGTKPISEVEARAILDFAFKNGVNFFDTSDKYGDGRAERLLGEFFGGRHGGAIVATKCGITSEGKRNFSREYVVACAKASLKRLRSDCIDIFQLTNPSLEVIREAKIFETLDYLKSENIIRFSGISVGTIEEGLEIVELNRVDTLQVRYDLLDISAAKELIPRAYRKNIGIIIKSPLDSGLLSGKYDANTEFPSYDSRRSFLMGSELERRVKRIGQIMRKYNISKESLIKFSILFLLSNKYVSTIIPGVSSLEQLRHNLSVLDKREFDERFLGRARQDSIKSPTFAD